MTLNRRLAAILLVRRELMFLLFFAMCAPIGCKWSKGTDRVLEAQFSRSPEQTVGKILAEFDLNKDNELDRAELERCPSLTALLDSTDKPTLTANALIERVRANQIVAVRSKFVRCFVTLDGRALSDAIVTLTPESFHGTGIPLAMGATGPDGKADLKAEGGVVNAFYRVTISKLIGGLESLRPIYNSATTLGAEVGAFTASGRAGRLEFSLWSR